MSKSKKKTEENDAYWSKNNGENIRFRKRKIEEEEARAMQEDALKELVKVSQELRLYEDR